MAEPGRSLVHIGLPRLVPLCRVKFGELDSWMARGHWGTAMEDCYGYFGPPRTFYTLVFGIM